MPDYYMVERGGTLYKLNAEDMASIQDTDLLVVDRSGTNYKITGSDLKASVGVGEGSLISPTIPPFSGYATQEVDLSDPTEKVEFSLDGVGFSSTLNVPINTFYYVNWTSDILSAAHDSDYQLDIFAEFPEINQTINPTIKFRVDKIPDSFTFFTESDVPGNSARTVDAFSPLDSINAPTSIWASSDAALCEIRVADSGWFTAPTAPNTYYVERGQVVQMRHTTGSEPTTTYTSTLFIGYGTGAGENESATLTSTTRDLSYDPQPLTLNTGDEIATEGSTFNLPTATGINVDHVATDWEVASDPGFTSIVDSSLDDSANTNTWQSTASLVEGNTYYARARYIDSSGQKSDWNEKSNLLCDEYSMYRLIVRIQGGRGGKAYWNNSDKGFGANGGQGQVYLDMTYPAKAPVGYVNSGNGGQGDLGAAFGSGFGGANGGASTTQIGYGGGGGGGAGGFQMRMSTSDNYTFMAAVGGTGGRGAMDNFQSNGGVGGSLPMSDGGTGTNNCPPERQGTPGYGGKMDYNDPSDPNYNPVPVSGTATGGQNHFKCGGGGGGGYGAVADGGIPFDGSNGKASGEANDDGSATGGGGGASWNRPVGFILGNTWEVKIVNNGYNSNGQELQKASLLTPTSFATVGTRPHGNRQISDMGS